MSRIFLIGFMGSGKSSVGRSLSERLEMPLVDVDAMIERSSGRTIPEIFAEDGEEAFRGLEHDALSEACAGPDAVIACGGGVVLRDENRALMRSCGDVVYLAVSPEEAVARIGDTSGRPLLAGDAARMASSILDARLSLYRATAHHVVDTAGRDIAEVVDEVLSVISGSDSEIIRVNAGDGYDIRVGVAVLGSLGRAVLEATGAKHAALVTDENVDRLWADTACSSLEKAGLTVSRFAIPAGEVSKTWVQAGTLLEAFASAGLDRRSVIVALGGGVVGDLAGFCAATYMRGVALVHVPTSLLAQVDSSIGGKTGVDLAAGKNLAGAFWQPALVLTDTAVIQTLPDDEWANGIVEAVKTAFLQGGEAVEWLERSSAHLMARDEVAVREMVLSCARFKAGVVSEDERESGLRECLNLGHTLGHAIEKVAGYGIVPHGLAVAEGMRFAARLAEEILGAPAEMTRAIDRVLSEMGVQDLDERYDRDALLGAMLSDKKSRGSVVRFVLLTAPGEWKVVPVEQDVLSSALDRWIGRA